ncbi:MAG: hypothetical protein JSU57_00440 [Candidatus Heimdallarchaeota archaeon]|nr:MAG: hypothetical protein JSU57_00440 [Candidatus Heimdallarchaeota archaeon]
MNDHSKESSVFFDNLTKIRIWIKKNSFFVTIILFIIIKLTLIGLYKVYFDFLVSQERDFFRDSLPHLNTGDTLIDLLGTRWDSEHFLRIAILGSYLDPDDPTNHGLWNFSPLYPLLIRLLVHYSPIPLTTFISGNPYTLAAVWISNFFSLTATGAFFKMSRIYLSEEKSIASTLLLAFFPTVFVFGTVAYSEPIFLTFGIVSWYFFEKKKYLLSGLSLTLASLVRFAGTLLFFLYIFIYFGRKIKEENVKNAIGCLVAIPLFPILVVLRASHRVYSWFDSLPQLSQIFQNIEQKCPLIEEKKEKIGKIMEFLDIGLSWVLIWGVIPLLWMIYVDTTAPITLAEVQMRWGAKLDVPFSGLRQMFKAGSLKWGIEKLSFAFLFLGVGLFSIRRRPSFSLLIIAQTIFYTSWTGIHAWGIPRYVGTIFHGHITMTEELKTVGMVCFALGLYILYGFKVLWEFTHWSVWLI